MSDININDSTCPNDDELKSTINVDSNITASENDLENLQDTNNLQTVNQVETQIENQVETTESDFQIQSQLDENQNKNCNYNKKKDEKLKNIMTYSAIPFIIVAIVISLFNIGRVRYPLSFLFLALGFLVLSVFSFIRSNKIKNECSCKSCQHSSKSSLQIAIFYAVVTLCLLGAFIYFMVVKQ